MGDMAGSLVQHTLNPTVNTTTKSEQRLARAVAKLEKEESRGE